MEEIMKKMISMVMAALLIACAAWGCSQEPVPIMQNFSDNVEESPISGELRLALFQGGYGIEFWDELIKEFNKLYPQVEVEYKISPKIGEIISPEIIAGDIPDLIYLNQAQEDGVTLKMIKEHRLLELTDVFKSKSLDQAGTVEEQILDGLLDTTFYKPYGDDKIFLAPFNTAVSGLIYNQTLFNEKGWKTPSTWDEFFALGDRCKKEGRYLLVYPGMSPGYLNQLLLPAIASGGGKEQLYDFFSYQEGCTQTPEMKKILDNIERISQGEYILPGCSSMDHTQAQAAMMQGQALFVPSAIWIENEMRHAQREGGDSFEYGLLTSLKLEEGDPAYVSLQPEQIYIPSGAKNPEAAKIFLKFLYTDTAVSLFGEHASGIMATKGAVEKVKGYLSNGIYNMCSVLSNPEVKTFVQSYQTPRAGSGFDVIDDIFENGMKQVLGGRMTAEEWGNNMEQSFSKVRRELIAP